VVSILVRKKQVDMRVAEIDLVGWECSLCASAPKGQTLMSTRATIEHWNCIASRPISMVEASVDDLEWLAFLGAGKRRQDCLGSAQIASHGHEMSLRSSETFLEKFFGWVLA